MLEVLLALVATSTSGDRVEGPVLSSRPISRGRVLARDCGRRFMENRLLSHRTADDFESLTLADQRDFLDEWPKVVPATSGSQRLFADLRAKHHTRVDRTTRAVAVQREVLRRERAPPPSELGLVAVEAGVTAAAVFAWKLAIGVAAASSDLTGGTAAAYLGVDAAVTTFGAGLTTFAVASASEVYEPAFGASVLGAAVGYLLSFFVSVAVIAGADDRPGTNTVHLETSDFVVMGIAGVLLPSAGAVLGSSFGKEPM